MTGSDDKFKFLLDDDEDEDDDEEDDDDDDDDGAYKDEADELVGDTQG